MKSDNVDMWMRTSWLFKNETKAPKARLMLSKSDFTKVCDKIKETNIKYGRIGRAK